MGVSAVPGKPGSKPLLMPALGVVCKLALGTTGVSSLLCSSPWDSPPFFLAQPCALRVPVCFILLL